jgi:Lipopolysaccharide kinase (Kdo/WaaP) family
VPEPVAAIVRLAPEWDRPDVRASLSGLEAVSRQVASSGVIHAGRNLLFRHRVGGEEVVVKRFSVIGGRRLVYRLRTSKAVRTFDHASRLIALGIGTPRPLAAVDVRQGRALLTSFYCCAFVPAFREARVLKQLETPDRATLLEQLGEFIGRLHESGVLHRDLTSGNVLLVEDQVQPGTVTFQLVDLNRMTFGRVGARAGLANLAQLRLHDDDALLRGYCRFRGLAVARAARYYHLRLGLRSFRQTLKERTRPWRRRLGL